MSRSRDHDGHAVDAGGAAERLGTNVRFVRQLVFERRIAYVKLGRHVHIATRDLDAFIRASRVEVGQYPTLRGA
jgi:excisionase family DNA binding protein